MTDDQQRATDGGAGGRPLLITYVAAIFLSAALLFVVQPMSTKMVLPRLGGSASVWSVAMVFFQAALLAGYAYAHLLTRYVPGRLSAVIHVAVLLLATLTFPLAIAAGWGRPPVRGESLWLVGLFAASIGLPFFALSANGPLLQAWFARSGHAGAKDPYFLYAASNVGSFLALLSYPLAIEPLTRLGQQTQAWSIGFFVLVALIGACGVFMGRASASSRAVAVEQDAGAPPTWRHAGTWMALAAIPSALLIALTAYLSTDVAPSPLLWVIPLALYLATFVIVFQTRPVLPHRYVVMIQPILLAGLVATMLYSVTDYLLPVLLLHVVAFFVTALVCHGELARRRPSAGHLTAFYLWMSAGGVVGGMFAGLIAPHVFSWVAEYPLLIVLAILCRPGLSLADRRRTSIFALALVAAVLAIALPATAFHFQLDGKFYVWGVGALLALALAASLWRNPLAFAAIIAILFAVVRFYEPDLGRRVTERSFFGVLKIVDTADGYRVLEHGTTIHGAERMSDIAAPAGVKPLPLTYYHRQSAMPQTVAAARQRAGGLMRVAVVGLGTGTLSCYSEPGEDWTYYEIDPVVVRMARDPARFTFLTRCAPGIPVILGDARLKLGDERDASFDLIIVDAFTSDVIPVHLLTRQAMEIFARKLKPHGMIGMHVSNQYLELISVVASVAQANGLVARTNPTEQDLDDDAYRFSSSVVACARTDADLAPLAFPGGWIVVKPDPRQWVWTDDYSNIVGAMIRQYRHEGAAGLEAASPPAVVAARAAIVAPPTPPGN
jgi:spermidine synthase